MVVVVHLAGDIRMPPGVPRVPQATSRVALK